MYAQFIKRYPMKLVFTFALLAFVLNGCREDTETIVFHDQSYSLQGVPFAALEIGLLADSGYMHRAGNKGLFIGSVVLNQDHSETIMAQCKLDGDRWIRDGFTEIWDGKQIRERSKYEDGIDIKSEYRKWRSDGTEIE